MNNLNHTDTPPYKGEVCKMKDDFLFSLFFNLVYISVAIIAAKYILKYVFRLLGERVEANSEQAVSKEVNGLFLKIKGTIPLKDGVTVADKYRYHPERFANALWGEISRIAMENPRSHLYKNARGEQTKVFQSLYTQFESVVAEKD